MTFFRWFSCSRAIVFSCEEELADPDSLNRTPNVNLHSEADGGVRL